MIEPIVVRAREGSFWRTPKAAKWSWMVIVLDENGALVSDYETACIFFGVDTVHRVAGERQ